jgi:hypothetical protein
MAVNATTSGASLGDPRLDAAANAADEKAISRALQSMAIQERADDRSAKMSNAATIKNAKGYI